MNIKCRLFFYTRCTLRVNLNLKGLSFFLYTLYVMSKFEFERVKFFYTHCMKVKAFVIIKVPITGSAFFH